VYFYATTDVQALRGLEDIEYQAFSEASCRETLIDDVFSKRQSFGIAVFSYPFLQ
jgi:hypothetical protein